MNTGTDSLTQYQRTALGTPGLAALASSGTKIALDLRRILSELPELAEIPESWLLRSLGGGKGLRRREWSNFRVELFRLIGKAGFVNNVGVFCGAPEKAENEARGLSESEKIIPKPRWWLRALGFQQPPPKNRNETDACRRPPAPHWCARRHHYVKPNSYCE